MAPGRDESTVQSPNKCYGLSACALLVELLSGECQRTSLMSSQNWYRYLFGAGQLVIDGWITRTYCQITLMWLSLDLTDDKSRLVLAAKSQYPSQCRPKSMSPYDVTGPQCLTMVFITLFNRIAITVPADNLGTLGATASAGMVMTTFGFHACNDNHWLNFPRALLQQIPKLNSTWEFTGPTIERSILVEVCIQIREKVSRGPCFYSGVEYIKAVFHQIVQL